MLPGTWPLGPRRVGHGLGSRTRIDILALGAQCVCVLEGQGAAGDRSAPFTPNAPAHPWGNRRLLGQLGAHGQLPAHPPPLHPSFFSHSPACPRTWDPARTRGCVGWHWAQFLRLCLCPGGTWISHTPSCGREKGGERSWL